MDVIKLLLITGPVLSRYECGGGRGGHSACLLPPARRSPPDLVLSQRGATGRRRGGGRFVNIRETYVYDYDVYAKGIVGDLL